VFETYVLFALEITGLLTLSHPG